jgi:type VI secretion system protein ImpA
MAVLDIESLLAPVSDSDPCGPNMEYESPFLELQELARGKPEQVIGDDVRPAQEPAWSAVQEAAESLFASTKDLRVAGLLLLSLTKTEGVAGFETGLNLIRQLLEQFWDYVHPMLDAEDDNDPTFRINSLISAIASDEILGALRVVPLVESRQFGKHSLRNYRIATGVLRPADDSVDPEQELSRIEAAFTDAPADQVAQTAATVSAAADHLNAIQHILLDKAGGIPEDLRPLSTDLKEMKSLLDAQLVKRGVGEPENTDDGTVDGAGVEGGGAAPVSSGAIRSRSDVVAALDRICDYYATHEPSSPVPMLLQRAKRLVNKSFIDIIRDLTPGGLSEAELFAGLEKEDE